MGLGAATESFVGLNPDGVGGKSARTVEVTLAQTDGTTRVVEMEVVAISLPDGSIFDAKVLGRLEELQRKTVAILELIAAQVCNCQPDDIDKMVS